MPGLGIGAYTAIFLCNLWPRETFFPLFFGSALEPLKVSMLTWALKNGKPAVISGMLGFAGVGTGLRIIVLCYWNASTLKGSRARYDDFFL